MFPGSDLLDVAFDVIDTVDLDYYQYNGREKNSIGFLTTLYKPKVKISGSFQPVAKQVYYQFGLDFQKKYYYLFAEVDFLDVGRDVAGDQVSFSGRRYQCESATPWFAIDGWSQILLVDIGMQKNVGFGSSFGVFGG